MKLNLSTASISDRVVRKEFRQAYENTEAHDGVAPFSDQALVDLNAGNRVLFVLSPEGTSPSPVGYAVEGRGELELFIAPSFRGRGFGRAGLALILSHTRGKLLIWAHGDHPAARALAKRFGFVEVRRLMRMVRQATVGAASAGTVPDGFKIGTFHPGREEETWVSLNARVFHDHPEQGQLSVEDLHARENQEWFRSDDFLVARTTGGRMVGYNWVKILPGSPSQAEIYVVGVDPLYSGKGLGRTLMNEAIRHCDVRGVHCIYLYVEADNMPAFELYQSLGFEVVSNDVQYAKTPQ